MMLLHSKPMARAVARYDIAARLSFCHEGREKRDEVVIVDVCGGKSSTDRGGCFYVASWAQTGETEWFK